MGMGEAVEIVKCTRGLVILLLPRQKDFAHRVLSLTLTSLSLQPLTPHVNGSRALFSRGFIQ